MARRGRVGDRQLRPLQDRGDRHRRIGRHRHERRVRAVLQQPPHQIGEQVTIAAHGRVDAACRVRTFLQQRLVERLAHAVQTLKFITVDAAGILDHARHRQRIVGRELRIEPRARCQQLPRANEIGQVGHRLAGEYRVVRKASLLRALDLGVPVSALHQPHHQPAVQATGEAFHVSDHVAGALLISLHGEPEPVPAGERAVGEHGRDHRQREFQPVGLLGIDGEIEIVVTRLPGEIDHVRHQFAHHPLARQRLVARMQRRQLYGNARPRRQCAARNRRCADRLDRIGIGSEIARRVRRGPRAFAQHVERVAQLVMARSAVERIADGLAEHEMRAKQAHRLSGRRPHRRHAKPLHQRADDPVRGFAGLDDPRGDAQRPGRGRHQERRRPAVVLRPVAGLELVLDQPVGGRGIGNPQQRLCQNHERQSLASGQGIGMEEVLNPAEAAGSGPDRLDQPAGPRIDPHFRAGRTGRGRQKDSGQRLIGRRKGRLKARSHRVRRRPRFRHQAIPRIYAAARQRRPGVGTDVVNTPHRATTPACSLIRHALC